MRLPILALFERSLRIESRAFTTYAKRLGLAAIVLLCLIIAQAASWRVGAAGLDFLNSVVYVTFWFILLAGVGYFASAVAEEKEEATLGLLKMSNLNAAAILLGKSTSRLLGVLMLLLVQFPFTLLAVTLGGVSLDQVVAAYATLLAFLVFLCNLSLLASVCCKTVRGATVLAGVLIGGFLAGGPLGTVALSTSTWPRQGTLLFRVCQAGVDALNGANPLVRIREVMTTGFDGTPFGFQVVSNLVLGAACFGLAWLSFGFFTRETAEGAPGRTAFFRRGSPFRWLGVSRPWGLAVAWKEFHFTTGGRLMIIGRFALIIGIVVFMSRFFWGGPAPERAGFVGGTLMFVSLLVGGLEFASDLSKSLRSEVQWHTLPDLMMLPISARQLLWSKVAGILPAMVPYAVCFVVGAMLCPTEFGRALGDLFGRVYGWHMIAQGIAFVSFTAYLSLVVRRFGALAAGGIWIVGNWLMFFFLGFFVFRGGGVKSVEVMFGFLALVFVGLAICFHRGTVRRLERLAGE